MLTPVERMLILRGADLLKDIGPLQLRRLAEVTREVEWWKGDTVYKEDDLADALYLVVEGRFRVAAGERVTSEVGPGEAFGTWALVDESQRGHRVECIEDGLALMLSRDDFDDVAAGDLTLLREVVRALTRRLRSLVSERPDEARIEGEGVEKPEALDESKSNVLEIETSTSSKAVESLPSGEALGAATHDLALPGNGEAHVGDATEPE